MAQGLSSYPLLGAPPDESTWPGTAQSPVFPQTFLCSLSHELQERSLREGARLFCWADAASRGGGRARVCRGYSVLQRETDSRFTHLYPSTGSWLHFEGSTKPPPQAPQTEEGGAGGGFSHLQKPISRAWSSVGNRWIMAWVWGQRVLDSNPGSNS